MKMRTLLKCALLSAALASAVSANAQQAPQKNSQGAANDAQKPAAAKSVSPKPIKKTAKKKAAPAEPTPPSLDERLTEHRLAVRKGEDREPSSAFLIEEITVTGTYKSVEGYGAFLRTSNSRTFFGYKGMPFYDGFIMSIEPDQVVFQQNQSDGKKRQIVKAYDPSSLRSTSINEKAEREQKEKNKEKDKEKKAKKEEPKKDAEEGDPTDDEE